MTRYLLTFFYIVFLAGCGSQSEQISPVLESRSPLASTLQEQGKYADALIQWQIILTANPDDPFIESRINSLQELISNKVDKLFKIAEKARSTEDEKLERKAFLQILALDPNNISAIDALRKTEWQIAMEKANSKTQTIKEYFVESQAEAQRSILLTRFREKGERYTQGKKYTSLIKLANEFEIAFPDAKEPQNWRFYSYSKLADQSVSANKIEQAITYYDMAIETANKGSALSLVNKNKKLRKQVSDQHYKLAMRHFKSDLNKAIELLSKSVSIYAGNVKAKQQLAKATKIRENLIKIKNMKR